MLGCDCLIGKSGLLLFKPNLREAVSKYEAGLIRQHLETELIYSLAYRREYIDYEKYVYFQKKYRYEGD